MSRAMRWLLPSLLVGASTLAVIAAPAAAQGVAPPARDDQLAASLREIVLMPPVAPASEEELAGLPETAPAQVLTWERAYTLALVRARSGGTAAAESLDPQALAEQARRHGVADFGRFRKEFLAGRAGSGVAPHDPSGTYLAVLRRLQTIDDGRQQVAALENLSKLLRDLAQVESAGLSQLQIDQLAEVLVGAGQVVSNEIADLRNDLDELKAALGLSPHAAIVPDRRAIAAFRDVFKAVQGWALRPDRQLSELPGIVGRLPELGDAVVDGRPILGPIEQAPDRIEDRLTDAVRVAIKNREGASKARTPEDRDVALELRVRRRMRYLLEARRQYEAAKRNYVLTVRVRDQSLEQVFAPQIGAASLTRSVASVGGIVGLIADLGRIRNAEDRVVTLWTTFRAERLALYRDLGALPYDNWDAFYADLSAGHAAAGPPPAAPASPAGTPGR